MVMQFFYQMVFFYVEQISKARQGNLANERQTNIRPYWSTCRTFRAFQANMTQCSMAMTQEPI